MKPQRALLIAAIVTITFLGALSAFNYHVDPMCYYHCKKIDPTKKSVNHFYEVGQIIMNHPETEVILLGSSRAQTTPPLWIQDFLHRPTLNLGMGGADLFSKWAFLNMSVRHTKLNTVIWFADSFELTPEITDIAIKSTPAIRDYLVADPLLGNNAPFKSPWLEIFDHNTFEAAMYSLKKNPPDYSNQGSGSYLNIASCLSDSYPGERSPTDLEKEKDSAFEHYTRKILKSPLSEHEFELFREKLRSLSSTGIETRIVIIPYNPTFLRRLKSEFPDQFQRQEKWRSQFANLNISKVKVFDFFDGIPGDDGSVKFWNDGVHFTCHGAVALLRPVLNSL